MSGEDGHQVGLVFVILALIIVGATGFALLGYGNATLLFGAGVAVLVTVLFFIPIWVLFARARGGSGS